SLPRAAPWRHRMALQIKSLEIPEMAPVLLKMRNSNAAEQTPLKRRAPAPRKTCGPGLHTRGLLSVFCLVVLSLTGCLVGPNYKRPIVNTPATYRGLTDTEAASVTPASL